MKDNKVTAICLQRCVYLSEDELALVEEEIIVYIDVMGVMDQGSLCDTSEEP